jgi:sterol desaturase/sphingolipid hydroxylase (fatty acid hydroxylase superfamily)
VTHIWTQLITWFSGHVIVPLQAWLHLQNVTGDPHEIAEALLIAVAQLSIIGLIFRPLESLIPAEQWQGRPLTRVDRRYTLLMLLGLNPLFAYLVMAPIAYMLGWIGSAGGELVPTGVRLWIPWFDGHPLLLFLVYYVVYDLTYYWMHRFQHAIPWWWALHSLHHSQRQMSCWTNDRGSYLDGILQSVVLATVGLLMGVDPSEFALLMLIGELVQNLSHANVRLGFGRWLEKLFVAPQFHRLHHMRVDPERPTMHNCNFGQVLAVWDNLFGTALYGEHVRATGVGDPTVDADNECGIIAMQWGALKRFCGAFRRTSGWKLGEVAFGPHFEPIPISHIDLHSFQQTMHGTPSVPALPKDGVGEWRAADLTDAK